MPVLQKAVEAYKLWHGYQGAFPRLSRYTLGGKIDAIFSDLIESILMAGYAVREHKPQAITKASTKLDSLKFFIQVAWELKCLDNKKHGTLSEKLGEIGKDIGAWRKSMTTKQPPQEVTAVDHE